MTNSSRYLAINDLADALHALPADTVRQFTLLKEIDAKCTTTQPELVRQISRYTALAEKEPSDVTADQKLRRLAVIRELLLTNLPCYEEKMTIANLAADLVSKHLDRINHAFEIVADHEIPNIVKYGPKNHPAIIPDSKLPENKSVQTQRSESRREAIAARKAAATNDEGAASDSTKGVSNNSSIDNSGNSGANGTASATGASSSSKSKGRNQHTGKNRESTPGASSKRKRVHTTNTNNANSHQNSSTSIHTTNNNGNTNNSSNIGNLSNNHINTHNSNHAKTNSAAKTPSQSHQSRAGSTSVKDESESSKKRPKVVKKSNSGKVAKSNTSSLHNGGHSQNNNNNKKVAAQHEHADEEENANEVYCICQQVSFGEMIGCDNDMCKIQWFHLQCVGLSSPPNGTWYCDDCKKQYNIR